LADILLTRRLLRLVVMRWVRHLVATTGRGAGPRVAAPWGCGGSGGSMETLDLSRWQFGITTVYHFILVPLTIGLAPMIAAMQTMWAITGKDHWYRLTKFFGKLFLINFALGVATGIVQEFQFGMNWSEYSRFVGDVFGAPLALEGLVAFFLESTFIGLW